MKISALLFATLLFSSRLSAVETLLTLDRSRSHIDAAITSSVENFTANVTAFEARIAVDAKAKRVAGVQVAFHVVDLKTGDERRDADMGLWAQTDQFPDCVYVLEALLPAAGGTFNARGKLILHGVTKALTIPVTVGFEANETCLIDGDLPLDISDFHLAPLRRVFVFSVKPAVQIKFHLEGRASSND